LLSSAIWTCVTQEDPSHGQMGHPIQVPGYLPNPKLPSMFLWEEHQETMVVQDL